MRNRCGIAAVILGLVLSSAVHAEQETQVTGQVVDVAGKAVAGAKVATIWNAEYGEMQPYLGVTTDAKGRFSLTVVFRDRKQTLMVFDKDRKTGGLLLLEEKSAGKAVEIKLAPLVHVHGRVFCKELNKAPSRVNVVVHADSWYVLRWPSDDASFSLRLPPGTYRLTMVAPDFQQVEKTLSLQAEKSDVDLKTLNMSANLLARYVGKTLPPWHVTDARGVKKTVRLSDYKGKWVLLEFWGFGSGLCMMRDLPNLIELYEDHKKDRDKFEILAFHDGSATDFAKLDPILEWPRAMYWGGRNLPFPILLDATRQTIEDFGIESMPTMLLIDPDGKLVGRVDDVQREGQLEQRLPPLPMPLRIARALDRLLWYSMRDATLQKSAAELSRRGRVPIRLDRASLQAVGVTPQTRIPLKMSGIISLRSVLNLLVEADGLAYEQDGKGLVIRGRKADAARVEGLSKPQRVRAKRIEKTLDRKVSFDFKDETLVEVVDFFKSQTTETFLLSPRDRKTGQLDLTRSVTGSAKDVPLREALQKLLDPIGMTYTIRDEAIVLTAKAKAKENSP